MKDVKNKRERWKKDQYYLLLGRLNGYTNSRGSWKPASGGCGCGCKGKCKWVWECAWYSLVNRIWKLLNIVDSFKRASAAWVGLWSQLAQSDIVVVVVSGKCGNMRLSGKCVLEWQTNEHRPMAYNGVRYASFS